jgi:hypothetical protein
MVMRWGLFWRTLRFDIKEAGNIINAAALLHNFIVEERLLPGDTQSQQDATSDENLFRTFSTTTMKYLDEATIPGSTIPREETPAPMVSDNNEPTPRGRHSQERINNKAAGSLLRDHLKMSLSLMEKTRPIQKEFKLNSLGMVYM